MIILDTLGPILLLIALGAALARWKFLGEQFQADLNKLAFWIALPAMIFENVANAGTPGSQTWWLLLTTFGTTVTIFGATWLVAPLCGMSPQTLGSFVQAAYRGNLVYIGVPVLAYAFVVYPEAERSGHIATALLAMAPTTAFYNVLAVIALQSGRDNSAGIGTMRLVAIALIRNPLIIACVGGIIFAVFGIPLPRFVDRSLQALGSAAVPVSLLCIGGALASMSLLGNRKIITLASLIKVGISPLVAWAIGSALGLSSVEMQIAIVLAATPTAAAAFIMARQMRGDVPFTSGTIALSTILSAVSLSVILWLTRPQ